MKIPVELSDAINALFEGASDSQIERATLLIKSTSVRDEVKEAITSLLIPSQEDPTMELADMLTTPELQEYIETKVSDAQTELTTKLTTADEAKTTAESALVEMMQDTIVLMATALRKEIDPLDLVESQKTYKAKLVAMDAETLKTTFTDFQKEINSLGNAPVEEVEDATPGVESGKPKADAGEEPDSASAPVEINNVGDVFKSVLNEFKKPASA